MTTMRRWLAGGGAVVAIVLAALVAGLAMLGACSEDAGASDHFLFRAAVTDETRGGATLIMDGIELERDASGGYVIERRFQDYDEALAASPAVLTSRVDSLEADTLDLRVGFCREYCGACVELGELRYEQVGLAIATDGALEDWSEFGACRRCKGDITERAICP